METLAGTDHKIRRKQIYGEIGILRAKAISGTSFSEFIDFVPALKPLLSDVAEPLTMVNCDPSNRT